MSKPFPALMLAGTSAAALLLAPGASGDESGLYLKGDAGASFTSKTELKEFFGPVTAGSKVRFDPGTRFGITAGYEVTKWFAAEVETGAMTSRINEVTDATSLHDATFSTVPFLVGLRFQCPKSYRLTPYFGGGLGGAVSVLDVDRLEIGGTRLHGSQGAVVFAYQALGGLRYRLTDNMSLSLEYRYTATTDPEWRADSTVGTITDHVRFGGAETHSVSLAFQYNF